MLPKTIRRPFVPPLKCQGIKTKLVSFIASNINWDATGRWIEPFLGSGVVVFNIQPEHALIGDINPHIISFYQSIYDGTLTSGAVRQFLEIEGRKLQQTDGAYYYEVRARFNETKHPLDFLFLNRSCFNGVMRFNSKGQFNVPFCRKPDRFRPAYITKIVNQVNNIRKVMIGKDWTFFSGDWRNTLADSKEGDFVYLDPPYIGRHTDYYSSWSEKDAKELAETASRLPCGVALSMWKQNKYRVNSHLDEDWTGMIERVQSHFYHVGATEDLRNEMLEALLITPGYEAQIVSRKQKHPEQLTLF